MRMTANSKNTRPAAVELDWPSLEMLNAGAAALDIPGVPLARIEAVWMAMRATVANVTIKRPARLNDAKAAPSADTERLDHLSKMGGFVAGMSDGAPAYRILTLNTWHSTLLAAIDEVVIDTSKKNSKLRKK